MTFENRADVRVFKDPRVKSGPAFEFIAPRRKAGVAHLLLNALALIGFLSLAFVVLAAFAGGRS